MSETLLVKQLAATMADADRSRIVLVEMARTIRPLLTQEAAQDFLRRAKCMLEVLDQGTAHLPGDHGRAIGALALLAALREALGLPPE